jgi:GNAT superfamily N-acetyltransferase
VSGAGRSDGGLLDGLTRFARWYAGVAEGAARWYRENEPAIRRVVEAGLDFANNFPIAMAMTSATFARGGWSEVPLGNMELSELTPLVERLWDEPDDEAVRRELDGAILAYFRRNGHAELSELVDGWREHFADRHETFEEALFAHKEGLYRLSIPALAAEVEGILRDLTREYGRGDRKWLERFNEAFCFEHGPNALPPPPDPERLAAEFRAMPMRERFEEAEELRARFALVRINELFASGDYDDPVFASSVRRHAILHGGFNSYGELESLRLFFLLDLLHDAVGRYEDRVWLVEPDRRHRALLRDWTAEEPSLASLIADIYLASGGRKKVGAVHKKRWRWIAYHGGRAAGFAALEADGAGGPGQLVFFVAPPFRRRGVSTRILRLALKEARRAGLPSVTVEADRVGAEDGPAARCLARAGFAPPEGTERAYLVRFGVPDGGADGERPVTGGSSRRET